MDKQEPAAWRNTETGEFCTGGFLRKDLARWIPLYLASPKQEYQYEVVAEHADGTYTTRRIPKREWFGLTADEIWKCNKAETGSAVEFHICSAHQNVMDFAEAIEAELKDKNSAPYTKNDTSDRVLHKQWVGLTDEDIDVYALDIGVTANKAPPWLVKYARDIEAALKEKNRG